LSKATKDFNEMSINNGATTRTTNQSSTFREESQNETTRIQVSSSSSTTSTSERDETIQNQREFRQSRDYEHSDRDCEETELNTELGSEEEGGNDTNYDTASTEQEQYSSFELKALERHNEIRRKHQVGRMNLDPKVGFLYF